MRQPTPSPAPGWCPCHQTAAAPPSSAGTACPCTAALWAGFHRGIPGCILRDRERYSTRLAGTDAGTIKGFFGPQLLHRMQARACVCNHAGLPGSISRTATQQKQAERACAEYLDKLGVGVLPCHLLQALVQDGAVLHAADEQTAHECNSSTAWRRRVHHIVPTGMPSYGHSASDAADTAPEQLQGCDRSRKRCRMALPHLSL